MGPHLESSKNLKNCYFYHSVDLPDGRKLAGEWDLRDGIEEYLGRVDFRGKRVLDVGAANGFLSFSIEKRGAKEIISFDLDPDGEWDVVPYAGMDFQSWLQSRKAHIGKLNNGYWYCHRAFKSKAKLLHGTVYDLPPDIGKVDIAVVGSILLHLRDPWTALRNILAITRETVIIVEKLPRRYLPLKYFRKLDVPWITFLPDSRRHDPIDGWWILTPSAIRRMIGVLGFQESRVTFHKQPLQGKKQQLFTVVGSRTHP